MASLRDEIVNWVAKNGDEEFCVAEGPLVPEKSPNCQIEHPIVYCPKASSFISRLQQSIVSLGVSIVGWYGIPDEDLRKRILDEASQPDVWFFGDLDGPDLMSYFALSDENGNQKIQYLGISDRFLNQFSVDVRRLAKYEIPATAAEREAIDELLDLSVPLEQLVGRQCLTVLQSGKKIEIEGILWEVAADNIARSILPPSEGTV